MVQHMSEKAEIRRHQHKSSWFEVCSVRRRIDNPEDCSIHLTCQRRAGAAATIEMRPRTDRTQERRDNRQYCVMPIAGRDVHCAVTHHRQRIVITPDQRFGKSWQLLSRLYMMRRSLAGKA